MKPFKHLPVLLLLLAVVLLYLPLQERMELSTKVIDILPQSEAKRHYELLQRFEGTKLLYVAVKGEDESALRRLEEFTEKVLELPFVTKRQARHTGAAYRRYLREYRYYTAPLEQPPQDYGKYFAKERERLMQNPFYSGPDSMDPLGIFPQKPTPKPPFSLKNGVPYLQGYGYFTLLQLHPGANTDYATIYDAVQSQGETIEGLLLYSPLFYHVENARAIKSQVHLIMAIAAGVLFVLYILLIRNVWLLLQTVTALATSSLLALLVLGSIYGKLSIFVAVFGVSLTAVAIDYMFHHYTHGFYASRRGFNREVFAGYLTTAGSFCIIAAVDFTLIRQIALFAAVSLSVAYLHFSFLFPRMGFAPPKLYAAFEPRGRRGISPMYFLGFALLLTPALPHISFNTDLRQLDYENTALRLKEEFFARGLQHQKQTAFLLEAQTLEQLVQRARAYGAKPGISLPLATVLDRQRYTKRKARLKGMDFKTIKANMLRAAQAQGFAPQRFAKAYEARRLFPPPYELTLTRLQKLGFDVIQYGNRFYTRGSATVDYAALQGLRGVTPVSAGRLFARAFEGVYEQLFLYGAASALFVLAMLWLSCKRRIAEALGYLLPPLGVIALYGALFELNVLMVFMGFVILAVGIDYSIYMAHRRDRATMQAVGYSLISTFAGFGVLVFSSVNALYSIGIIAVLGIGTIAVTVSLSKKG